MIEPEFLGGADPRPRRFLFLLASTRRDGNSEWLARQAAASLAPDCLSWLCLSDLELPAYRDLRDQQLATPWPEGDAARLLQATLQADDLVVVSPLYWYGPTTPLKHYLDHWSAWLRLQALDFRATMRGKRMWLVCAMSDSDTSLAKPLVTMLQSTAKYMNMEFAGALVGVGNGRGEVRTDQRAVSQAQGFFTRTA
jgi:NAD(P)H-dependent FMN reductase